MNVGGEYVITIRKPGSGFVFHPDFAIGVLLSLIRVLGKTKGDYEERMCMKVKVDELAMYFYKGKMDEFNDFLCKVFLAHMMDTRSQGLTYNLTGGTKDI